MSPAAEVNMAVHKQCYKSSSLLLQLSTQHTGTWRYAPQAQLTETAKKVIVVPLDGD